MCTRRLVAVLGIFGILPVLCTLSGVAAATEIVLEAHAHQTLFFGQVGPTQTETVSGSLGDDSLEAEALVTSDGLRFFTRTGGPTEPVFSSALARGDAFYGVGASGITGLLSNDFAEASISFSFENPLEIPVGFSHSIRVEPVEALAWVLSSFGGTQEFGPISVVTRLSESFVQIAADGTRGPEFNVFDLDLTVRRNEQTRRFERQFSDDWRTLFGQVDDKGDFLVNVELVDEEVNGNRIFGARIDPFDVDWFVTNLQPGERVELSFQAQAIVNRLAETGGQAFVGDPFSLAPSVTDSFRFNFEPLATTVPVPPTGILLISVLLLPFTRRRLFGTRGP